MSSKIATVETVRLRVEPVDVEVDIDGSIAWTSLQSVFPGCSGMYYKGNECKAAVRFDGKQFYAPGGSWSGREYFVTIGSRSQMPFGGYENASKQFERSVNAVQRMLGSSYFEPSSARRSVRSTKVPEAPKKEESPPQIEEASPKKAVGVESSTKRSSVEEQFMDLARIANGKDSIIDGQREEVRKLREQIDTLAKKECSLLKELDDAKSRLSAQEQELELLRAMSLSQSNTNHKVTSLIAQNAKLSSENEEMTELITSLTQKLEEAKEKLGVLSTENEQLRHTEAVMVQELQLLKEIRDKLQIETSEMASDFRTRMERLQTTYEDHEKLMVAYKEIEVKHNAIQESSAKLTEENAHLLARVKSLEAVNENQKHDYTGSIEHLKETMRNKEDDWQEERRRLERDCDVLKASLDEVQATLEAVARDAASNAQRAHDAEHSRDEMRKILDSAEYKVQAPLRAQIESLSEQLRDSETRVKELNDLTAMLTLATVKPT